MRGRTWGLLLAAAVFSPVTPARATVPVVVIDGRGWGHGVGMAQDGAFWMAKAGASTPQILGQFYPGVSIGRVTPSAVRVAVFNGNAVSVAFPNGGRIDDGSASREADGFPVVVDAGGQVRLTWTSGRITVQPISAARAAQAPTTTTTPSTTTTLPLQPPPTDLLHPATTTTTVAQRGDEPPSTPSSATAPTTTSATPSSTGPLTLTPAESGTITLAERSRSYRGVINVINGDGAMRLVNQLDVEQYLRGMGEVRDGSWPPAALRTQAIAARTYALRGMAAAGELCDTTRCQVYLGTQAEYAQMDKAVKDTAGQVLTFNKALASAVYSANAGGQTASPEEGFGTTGIGYPYLRSVPYETHNPMPWSVTVGLDDLAAHLGHAAVSSVSVSSKGPSGRALTVTLGSGDDQRVITGRAFAAALGLRSTMFTVRMATADVAPAPLSGGGALQTPPDELSPDIAAGGAPTLTRPATRVELPDRTSFGQSWARRVKRPLGASTPVALGELLLALLAVSAISARPRSIAAKLRSWRAVPPPEDDRR